MVSLSNNCIRTAQNCYLHLLMSALIDQLFDTSIFDTSNNLTQQNPKFKYFIFLHNKNKLILHKGWRNQQYLFILFGLCRISIKSTYERIKLYVSLGEYRGCCFVRV